MTLHRILAASGPPTPGVADSDPAEQFQAAMRAYRDTSGRMFPTWSEVLEVLQSLGYRKLADFA